MHEIYYSRCDYIKFWKEYLNAYAKRFYNRSIDVANMESMFEIAEGKNERYHYALYYMWSYDREIYEWYLDNGKEDFVIQGKLRMIKSCYSYEGQDYVLLRLVKFLDKEFDVLSYTGRNLELSKEIFPDEGSLVKFIRSAVKAMRRQGFDFGFVGIEIRNRI